MDMVKTKEEPGLTSQLVTLRPTGATAIEEVNPPHVAVGARAASRAPNPLPVSRNAGDIVLKLVTSSTAVFTVILLGVMATVLIIQAWPAITHYGLSFLTFQGNRTVTFSAEAAIQGTIYSSFLAILVAAPVGVLIAVFLSEMAHRSVRMPLGFLVELLAAIPSVIYGLWALFVLVPILGQQVIPYLTKHFGAFPLFANPSPSGLSMLAAALVLSVMIVPTIAAISRDVVMAVPQSQREAMYALGATRWEVIWKVLIPYARGGIIGGIVLGLARALGETMAVVMVIGTANITTRSITDTATTAPSVLVSALTEAFGLYRQSLLELAVVLLIMTLFVNCVARLLVWSVTRKYAT